MAPTVPRIVFAPILIALTISASETSIASVITPDALLAPIEIPSAVVTAPEV